MELPRLSDQAVQFVTAFDAFCDDWQINGFESWDLPHPRGPRWPDLCASSGGDVLSGTMVLTTPWHFPVLDSDNLGRVAMEQHAAAREQHAIDDVRCWPQYVQLFRIDFWKRVLCSRYSQNSRLSRFHGDLERLLAEILDLSTERLKRLIRRHRQLTSGTIRSLAGLR
jgi:hypothetical protein